MDRRGDHRTPIVTRIRSEPDDLDPDSVTISDYVDRDRVGAPVKILFGDGFYGQESSGAATWNWGQQRATLLIRNDSSSPRDAAVSFVTAGSVPPCRITIDPADGSPTRFVGLPIEHHVMARVGPWESKTIHLESDCPRASGDPRDLRFNVSSIRVSERVASGQNP